MSIRKAAAAVAGLAILLGVNVTFAQEKSGAAGLSGGPKSQIYCAAKPAGQLCNHGTADLLKLSGAKKQQWTEAVNRYNKAVDAATRQLLDESRSILSPEEQALVQRWFDKGVNQQINRL